LGRKPNPDLDGHISIAPTTVITYGTARRRVIITVDDARGDLLPNTNVNVPLPPRSVSMHFSIPREALHTDGGDFVYRVVNGKLVRTPVQVGVANLIRVEITSGLTEKDTLALRCHQQRELSNGLAVKIVD